MRVVLLALFWAVAISAAPVPSEGAPQDSPAFLKLLEARSVIRAGTEFQVVSAAVDRQFPKKVAMAVLNHSGLVHVTPFGKLFEGKNEKPRFTRLIPQLSDTDWKELLVVTHEKRVYRFELPKTLRRDEHTLLKIRCPERETEFPIFLAFGMEGDLPFPVAIELPETRAITVLSEKAQVMRGKAVTKAGLAMTSLREDVRRQLKASHRLGERSAATPLVKNSPAEQMFAGVVVATARMLEKSAAVLDAVPTEREFAAEMRQTKRALETIGMKKTGIGSLAELEEYGAHFRGTFVDEE